jgi:quinone-modifying oxidoreductase subunit QmoB
MDNAKLGVYLCSGCGIGDSVDMGALARVAEKEGKAALVRTHALLCGDEGVAGIRADAEREGLNTLCIAACSPRVKTEAFDFDPRAIVVDRVSLREHVAWCQKPREDDTQALAEDYLRMGMTRAKRMSLLAGYESETVSTILVVGGGVAGMNAALGAARAGHEVILVEKERELGGFMRKLGRRFPHAPPYEEPEPTPVAALADAVLSHARIAVRLATTVAELAGQPGQLDVTLRDQRQRTEGKTTTLRVGAVVQATGFRTYDATRLKHLGYHASPNVLTCEELEVQLARGSFARADGYPARSVAFILCAGSRDPEHLPYCSTVCCRVALKQALEIRALSPQTKVYVFYRDLRSPGLHEDFYRRVQRDPGIFITRGEVRTVRPGRSSIEVEVADTVLGERLAVDAEVVVLATGIQPATLDGAGALNLKYRQGPELPTAEHGFPDSKFICFPYETRRTAIFAAGCAREPMDSARAAEDAAGAAMKAIQALTLIGQGRALHPRAGDLSFPDFFLQRCTQCKRCTEECPFGALDEDVKGTPKPNPNRCRRCGVCMGACPERIVSFANYSVPMIGEALKSIEVPEAEEEKPRIVVLACENDACPAIDMAAHSRLQLDPTVRIQPVRCLGSMNIVWIADCLSKGIDAVMLLGCKFGDDYQCHFIKGSELASKRLENLQETLGRLMLDANRIRLAEVAISDFDRIPELVNGFAAEVRAMEPNPYKGF